MRTIALMLLAGSMCAAQTPEDRVKHLEEETARLEKLGVSATTVAYKDGETELEGYLAWPSHPKGPLPGVLVVHEWWGHNPYVRKRVEQLAQLGYVAFALDMYGKGVLAKDFETAGKLAGKFKDDRKLMRSRARAGLDVLLKSDNVDKARVAAIGYCFGGTTVLELARDGAGLACVVSFHGSLGTPMPAEKGKVTAKVLICHGADDPFVPAKEVGEVEAELRKAGTDWQLIKYSGAVHGFTNPDAGSDPAKGMAYNESAEKRSWKAMRDMFDEAFGK